MRPRPVEEGGKAERTICTSIWSSRASSRDSSHAPIRGAPSCRQAPLHWRSSSALKAKPHQNSVRDRFSPSPSVPVVVAASCARRPAHSGVAEECLIDQAHLCSLAQAPRAARHRRVRCGVGSLLDLSRVACARWPARIALARQCVGRTGSPIRTTPMRLCDS